MINATANDIARFMAKVDKLPNGCWYWMGARSRGKGNSKYYGTFHVSGHRGGQSVRAHRFSSEVFNEDKCPPGHHRDHTCNFSMCVNPAHIEIVTHAENQRRKMAARKICDHQWQPFRLIGQPVEVDLCGSCGATQDARPALSCAHEWAEYHNPSGWLLYDLCLKCLERRDIKAGRKR